jgi:radical SAM protein with 4Fe4S-binding SPASM domain
MTPALRIVSWNLTRGCNLACGHCYLDAEQRRPAGHGETDTATACAIVEQIADCAPGAMLVMTGGEPLLRDDLDEIVASAARAGLMPVVGTNGLKLTDARADALRAAGAVGVGISLDSVEPGFHDRLRGVPGAHARALAGIEAARRSGLAVQIQTTLFPENVVEIAAMAALAVAGRVMALHFFFLVCTGRGVTQTDLSPEQYEMALGDILAAQEAHPDLMVRARCAPYMRRLIGLKSGESGRGYSDMSSACLAGRSYLRITPDASVTPCPYIPDAIGNLKESRLGDIWRSNSRFQRLRVELPRGKCGDCDFRISCGGCRARALAATGELMAEDPKCTYVRPSSAQSEQNSEAARGATTKWSPEAAAMLERIPGFVRESVRRAIEQTAANEGLGVITLDYMRARRPSSLPFMHPKQPVG